MFLNDVVYFKSGQQFGVLIEYFHQKSYINGTTVYVYMT
jgi:hypothetical protein